MNFSVMVIDVSLKVGYAMEETTVLIKRMRKVTTVFLTLAHQHSSYVLRREDVYLYHGFAIMILTAVKEIHQMNMKTAVSIETDYEKLKRKF